MAMILPMITILMITLQVLQNVAIAKVRVPTTPPKLLNQSSEQELPLRPRENARELVPICTTIALARAVEAKVILMITILTIMRAFLEPKSAVFASTRAPITTPKLLNLSLEQEHPSRVLDLARELVLICMATTSACAAIIFALIRLKVILIPTITVIWMVMYLTIMTVFLVPKNAVFVSMHVLITT
jgi:hypothetical protein